MVNITLDELKHALFSVAQDKRLTSTVERVFWRIDIENNIDAGLLEEVHAFVVVGCVVNGVHTDGVDAELLEVLNVSLAVLSIGKWVGDLGGATGLVVTREEMSINPQNNMIKRNDIANLHATDVEPFFSGEESIALDGNGLKVTVTGNPRVRRNAAGKGPDGAQTEAEKRKLHYERVKMQNNQKEGLVIATLYTEAMESEYQKSNERLE